jgi:hypothetical protein
MRRSNRMRQSASQRDLLVWLGIAIVVVSFATVALSLVWNTGGASRTFTTVRGETVELYGRGVYRNDDVFKGSGNIASDVVTLIVAIPCLLASVLLHVRGSLRGRVALGASLSWFLYVYASLALGTAHNELFLAYVAIASMSLFAFIRVFGTMWKGISIAGLRRLPFRFIARFMILCGAITSFVWLGPLISALINDRSPERLGAASAMVTDGLDLAIITPATFVAGVLILRNRIESGLRIVVPLVALLVPLGPAIALSTYLQNRNGIEFTTGEKVGPVGGFLVLSTVAAWLTIDILRKVRADEVR